MASYVEALLREIATNRRLAWILKENRDNFANLTLHIEVID